VIREIAKGDEATIAARLKDRSRTGATRSSARSQAFVAELRQRGLIEGCSAPA
jgi:hypothetical protein